MLRTKSAESEREGKRCRQTVQGEDKEKRWLREREREREGKGLPCTNKEVAPQAAAWRLCGFSLANVTRIKFSVAYTQRERAAFALATCDVLLRARLASSHAYLLHPPAAPFPLGTVCAKVCVISMPLCHFKFSIC